MDLQKVRDIEIQYDAQEVLMRLNNANFSKIEPFGAVGSFGSPINKQLLKRAGSIGGRDDHWAPDLLPIISILKAHIRGVPFEQLHVDSVHRILNRRVKHLGIRVLESPSRCYLIPHGSRIRFIAESLLRYLRHFAENSAKACPLGLCPKCDGIFFIQRSGQKTCSTKCRFETWRETNPFGHEYWRPDIHLAKKKIEHLPSQKVLSPKTVVKIVGKFSPKPAKIQRKTRKAKKH